MLKNAQTYRLCKYDCIIKTVTVTFLSKPLKAADAHLNPISLHKEQLIFTSSEACFK